MKKLFLLFTFVLLIFGGCKNNNSVNPELPNASGSVLLKIDKENKPENVATIVALLTRQGYPNKSLTMNLLSDTSASGTFLEVPVGSWHLKIDAKDSQGAIVYTGQTDVNVLENQQAQVYLTLTPVALGVGSIQITVKWGTNTSGWVDYMNNPVLLRDNSFYDINGISHPTIIYENGYKMWFNCMAQNGKSYTFYATSVDGNIWTKRTTPVLSPSLSWDGLGTVTHSVIKDGSTYKLYYTGISGSGPYSYNYQIGLATSIDGISWEKNNTPVLGSGSGWETTVSSAEVVKRDSIYYMYYHGATSNSYAIGLATSTDGVNFTRHGANPIINKTANWEQKGPCCPTVIYDQNQFIMVFQNSEGNGMSFGKAYSTNGINWTKDSTPFFGCPNTSNDWASGYAAYPCLRKINNEYRIYYSGSNYFDQKTAKIGYTKKAL